jgi:hypothetical protein
MFWSCTISTREVAHSPFGPNFTGPTTVSNVLSRM